MKRKDHHPDKPTHVLTLIVWLIGIVGSLSLMFIAGHNNKSLVLTSLFTAWVSSPYAALIMANWKSFISTKRLNYLIPFISLGSVISYTFAHFSPGKTPAFVFLLVPFLSWVVIAIVILIDKKRAKVEVQA